MHNTMLYKVSCCQRKSCKLGRWDLNVKAPYTVYNRSFPKITKIELPAVISVNTAEAKPGECCKGQFGADENGKAHPRRCQISRSSPKQSDKTSNKDQSAD